jgi:ribonuclease-3
MNISKLEEEINYFFNDKNYLFEALTHSSYGKEKNNERLEYLGDAVLELSISEYLFKNYQLSEGKMTRLRASIVCSESLSKAASQIHLGEYLFLGKGEIASGGRCRRSILENAFEALIGAIFMDSNYENTKKIIYSTLKENIELALNGHLNNDYKTALQELVQQKQNQVIEYTLDRTTGPEHDKIFYVTLCINEQKCASGIGKTKKEAEQDAAKKVLFEKLDPILDEG